MSLRRTTFMLAAAVCAALASRSPALAAPTAADSGSPSVAALTICEQADRASGEEKTRLLDRGLELAEQAVDRDGSDAKAHFAVFCNLGKKTQSAGPSVRQVFVIDRLKREIDSALKLSPDDPAMLTAKGAFLMKLPSLLGGDEEEGKALLHKALSKDPNNQVARRYLSQEE
ncbi:MAG TPA: hypothetical protein VFD92_08060 [Candidatus Binatia bacterium]|nr:hypothetical protein [Candidatus Binatia bacterium]